MQPADGHTIYISRVDLWLACVLVGVPLGAVALGLYLLIAVGTAGFVAVFTGVLSGAVIAWLSIPCRYTLTDRSLVIECGRDREEIRYTEIRDVAPSSSPLSAPALSLRRVKILLNRGYRLISPRDREAFIAELRRRSGTRSSGAVGR